MKRTNEVSLSDTSMHDMNTALSELFSELDVLDELRTGVAKQEQKLRMTRSKSVISHTVVSVEYVAGKIKKLATFKRNKKASLTSMFQIH